ncbi:MAG: aminotransferase class V-fold PLP-dependent enzyme, partial [Clostridia bacterium]|nr:aminotransferase class V-fold PLP-dependent enzyme [Clostridia bacterium]
MSRFIYADNAATTAVSQPVLDAMLPYFAEHYGNPSSIYSIGRDAHTAVDTAREQTAAALGALPEEIYFTSGGSEADNWAIRGAALANRKKGRHIISSVFEHHAVLHTLKALEKEGWEVTYLKVYENGIVRPDDLRAAIRPDTVLVTIMYANNEIGTIQPIPELAGICHEKGVLFHTDAVQAIGHVAINVKEQGIDMLSLSAHKFHGPKGTGALYIKKGLRIPNLIEGGAQERGHRAGTENVAGIVGLGRAIEIACKDITARDEKVKLLRDALIDNLLKS